MERTTVVTASDPNADLRPLRTKDVRALYERPPSFTDFLPWVEYLPDSRCFLLEDGVSVGALFELMPVGTEARTSAFMTALRDAIQTAIGESIPEHDEAPWVLQCYVQDEPRLDDLLRAVRDYLPQALRDNAYTRHYLGLLAAHCDRISQPGGLFDDVLTGTVWRGQVRRVRAVLYRRLNPQGRVPEATAVEAELDDVATRLIAALSAAGVHCRRATGEDLYRWLLPWFNPRPACLPGEAERLLEMAPYPGDDTLPFGADLGEILTLQGPHSDAKTATWWFDGLPHTLVTVQGLRRVPEIGHMTAERLAGDHIFSLFDRLPGHTVMVLTLTLRPQDRVRDHIALVKRAAVGDSAHVELVREDATAVEREMASGNKLYPLQMAFYVRGEDLDSLRTHVNQLNALLLPNGLQPIAREADLLAL